MLGQGRPVTLVPHDEVPKGFSHPEAAFWNAPLILACRDLGPPSIGSVLPPDVIAPTLASMVLPGHRPGVCGHEVRTGDSG